MYRLSQLNTVKNNFARLGSLIAQESYVTVRNYHVDTIGFYVEDPIFASKFEANDIVLVEPISLNAIKGGELVLIYSSELNETIFCYVQKTRNKQYIGWQPHTDGSAPNFFAIHSTDLIYGIYRECLKTA